MYRYFLENYDFQLDFGVRCAIFKNNVWNGVFWPLERSKTLLKPFQLDKIIGSKSKILNALSLYHLNYNQNVTKFRPHKHHTIFSLNKNQPIQNRTKSIFFFIYFLFKWETKSEWIWVHPEGSVSDHKMEFFSFFRRFSLFPFIDDERVLLSSSGWRIAGHS